MGDAAAPHRTPAELVVKILTVHIVTTANYGYLCSLQHRSLKGWVGVARIIFFIFTPTVAYVELAASALQSFINFIRDEADDEITNFWFFLSAALGMHAYSKSDSSEAGSHKTTKLKLLQLSCAECDRKRTTVDWAWAGKLFICVFTLTQGIGTALVWIERIVAFGTFGLDDRNGVMGFSISILSIQALIILLMRFEWATNQPISPQLAGHEGKRSQTFTRIALASLLLQDYTRAQEYDSKNLRTITDFLLDQDGWGITLWPFLVVGGIIFFLWRELVEKLRLGMIFKIQKKYLGARGAARLRKMGHRVLMIAIAFDIITKIVWDIREVVENRPANSDDRRWLQGSISEMIPVL